MKHRLDWRKATRDEIAEHLRAVDIVNAEALGGTSVYRCRAATGRESIVISLPDAPETGGLIVDIRIERPPLAERRRTAGK